MRAVPAAGEANAALCLTIAKALAIAPRQVTLGGGATSRLKRIRVAGEPAVLIAALRRLVSDERRTGDGRRIGMLTFRFLSFVLGRPLQLFQPKATLSSTRVPNFSDERATALPPKAR